MKTKKDGKNILPRLKTWLLMGKTITQAEALRMWHTSRLAVYVHRLRKYNKMKIETKIMYKGDDTYAQYRLAK